MAKLPDSFFDDEPTEIKVPKGWTVDEPTGAEFDAAGASDDENEDEDPPYGDVPEEEISEETAKAALERHREKFPKVTKAWEEPQPKAAPKKRRHAFIEDDFDDEPAPVVQTKNLPKKKSSWVDDWGVDDDAPPLVKPNQRFGRGATLVVGTDDGVEELEGEVGPENAVPEVAEEEEPAPVVALPKRETIVPVKRLSEKALLVSLNISQWSGRRFDRQISDEVNASKAATSNAGRFNKMLLPDCSELAEVHRQTSSLRNWFVEKTMPWMNDGARITPSATYLDFTSEFRRREAEWTKAVDALIAAYPALKAKAPHQLQSMYNPEDYPMAYELRDKFSMAIRAFPLPDKEDFRVELDPATMAALKDSMADVEGDLARQVVGECYQRLGKAVGAMADRLGDPDAVFRNSLTENLAEAVSALRDLNICGDPELETMRRRIEKTLTVFTADELRNDMAARKTAAVTAKAAMEDIGRRMAGLY